LQYCARDARHWSGFRGALRAKGRIGAQTAALLHAALHHCRRTLSTKGTETIAGTLPLTDL
jgi:hypothetical protein